MMRSAALLSMLLWNPQQVVAAPDWLTGVNISGGELNPGKLRLNVHYTYPRLQELRYFASHGFQVFRVLVLSDRMVGQDTDGPVTQDWQIILELVAEADRLGAWIILDLHQYGAMGSGLVGRDASATAEFAAAWKEMAGRLKNAPNVIFGLMNEPHKQSAAEWLEGANAGIAAIRQAGATQLILVPGSYWDSALGWTTSDNAQVMLGIVDPAHNFAFEVHQYLDPDGSGTHPEVVPGSGAARLTGFTEWARAHHVKGFLGEFGFATTPEAMSEGEQLLAHLSQNKDVWRGWTYFSAGPWWSSNYMFSVEPDKNGDRAQMRLLKKYK